MFMQPSDVMPYHLDRTRGELYVGARHGTVGLEWPAVIEYQGLRFKFYCNEPMDLEFAQVYGGHAKYRHTSQQ